MKHERFNTLSMKCLIIVLLLMAIALGVHAENKNDAATYFSDNGNGDNWPLFNGTYGEQHFSPLTEINTKNIEKLGLAWYMDLKVGNTVTGPIEVNDVLYFAHAYSVVHAVNAITGKLIWKHDPMVAKSESAGTRMRQGWGSRGIAWWNNKIYVGTIDGRLIALNAKTGEQVWSVETLSEITNGGMFISGPPRVFDGKVIIGNGGADHTNARGFVTTYDAETGKQLWRFYTVPGNPADGFENDAMEMAAKTWHGEWWKHGGGGTVWNSMTYDAEHDQILLGTGNGSPWNHKVRSLGKGDNLFLCSVLALDANTGEYKWHYQINPGETWDYNAAMDMQLGEIEVDGKTRKVVVTAPKNGFFYVIDRTNGQLISAEQFAENVTWASRIDLKTGRPVENVEARFLEGGPVDVYPSSLGAHSWLPMSFDDEKDRVFIPVIELGFTYDDRGIDPKTWKHLPGNGMDPGMKVALIYDEDREPSSPMSSLLAWDVSEQKALWRVPTSGTINGGVLATRGNLVFQGEFAGQFVAFNADTGKVVWSFDTQKAPVIAPPISYMADGKQYITVLTGNGSQYSAAGPTLSATPNYREIKRRVLTFAVDGNEELPEKDAYKQIVAFADPDYEKPKNESLETGALLWAARCMACHGEAVIASGHTPDLRASAIVPAETVFNQFVRNGVMSRGMPSYQGIADEELYVIREYIRAQAAKLRDSTNKTISE